MFVEIEMNCKVCGTSVDKIFISKILNKYDVQYYKCSNCDYLQKNLFSWKSHILMQ